MSTRSKKDEILYAKHRKEVHAKTQCVFCDYTEGNACFISETKSFKVIQNLFPYSQWDGQGVLDHKMIVPKKHTDTLSDLVAHEAIEYIDIVASYESQGYSVYSRAPSSTRKTVIHQHTHLIKLGNRTKNIVLYIKKPYIRFIK